MAIDCWDNPRFRQMHAAYWLARGLPAVGYVRSDARARGPLRHRPVHGRAVPLEASVAGAGARVRAGHGPGGGGFLRPARGAVSRRSICAAPSWSSSRPTKWAARPTIGSDPACRRCWGCAGWPDSPAWNCARCSISAPAWPATGGGKSRKVRAQPPPLHSALHMHNFGLNFRSEPGRLRLHLVRLSAGSQLWTTCSRRSRASARGPFGDRTAGTLLAGQLQAAAARPGRDGTRYGCGWRAVRGATRNLSPWICRLWRAVSVWATSATAPPGNPANWTPPRVRRSVSG